MSIEKRLKSAIRDVPNFPKEGIVFKDITPILLDHKLCKDIAVELAKQVKSWEIDRVVGIESRGFLFGMMLANELQIPFVPIRKKGKLPYTKVSIDYELEYGSATIEIHQDAVVKGERILIHDDLLATGGTADAAAKLLKNIGAEIAGFCFLVNLSFLNGTRVLNKHSVNNISLSTY